MKTFAEYLDEYRGKATVPEAPELTEEQVLALVKTEQLQLHGSAVFYECISRDDVAEPIVYRLGTQIVLQDLSAQLETLVETGQLFKYHLNAYSANPSLRKP